MRVETFQNLRIYRYGVVGAETGLTTSRIGVVATQADVGRIVVYHRIHSTTRHTKEESWCAQFLEVAQVITPVRLWYDGYAIPLGLKQTADDRRTKGWVVDIGIAGEEDHIDVIPPQGAYLLYGCR